MLFPVKEEQNETAKVFCRHANNQNNLVRIMYKKNELNGKHSNSAKIYMRRDIS